MLILKYFVLANMSLCSYILGIKDLDEAYLSVSIVYITAKL